MLAMAQSCTVPNFALNAYTLLSIMNYTHTPKFIKDANLTYYWKLNVYKLFLSWNTTYLLPKAIGNNSSFLESF